MKSLRLLGISASPRGKGNSYYLLTIACRAAEEATQDVETEIYTFEKKNFAPCVHCYGCREDGQCVIRDDFQSLAEKWFAADVILYSVPVYHMSIPGQLKCFLDRLGVVAMAREKDGKGGLIPQKFLKCVGILTQGMHLFSGQEHAVTALVNHALIMGCLPMAGNMWESYIGASGWTEGLRSKTALNDLTNKGTNCARATVAAAETLGHNVAQLARIIRKGCLGCYDDLASDPALKQALKLLKNGGYREKDASNRY